MILFLMLVPMIAIFSYYDYSLTSTPSDRLIERPYSYQMIAKSDDIIAIENRYGVEIYRKITIKCAGETRTAVISQGVKQTEFRGSRERREAKVAPSLTIDNFKGCEYNGQKLTTKETKLEDSVFSINFKDKTDADVIMVYNDQEYKLTIIPKRLNDKDFKEWSNK